MEGFASAIRRGRQGHRDNFLGRWLPPTIKWFFTSFLLCSFYPSLEVPFIPTKITYLLWPNSGSSTTPRGLSLWVWVGYKSVYFDWWEGRKTIPIIGVSRWVLVLGFEEVEFLHAMTTLLRGSLLLPSLSREKVCFLHVGDDWIG